MPYVVADKFMRRCLDLAIRAEGMTYPNPMVGAIVVHKNIIIGEGYHIEAGAPHAEVIAINAVSDNSLLSESTLYVSLEPCSHYGKTPPCSDFIISSNIRNVVIGTTDTSMKVSGKGIEQLKKAGCDVTTGILEEECRRINKRFFTYNEKRRPYVILKWAQSADGYIDIKRPADSAPEPYWITGLTEKVLVHKWRASEQSILAGAGTIRTDKPRLNVREWSGRNPIKIILSRSGELNKYISDNETNGTLIVFTENEKAETGRAEKVLLGKDKPAAGQILEYLYEKGIQSVFIEGGAEVLCHFISLNLWDEARIFHGNTSFSNGVKAPVIIGTTFFTEDFSTSRLSILVPE